LLPPPPNCPGPSFFPFGWPKMRLKGLCLGKKGTLGRLLLPRKDNWVKSQRGPFARNWEKIMEKVKRVFMGIRATIHWILRWVASKPWILCRGCPILYRINMFEPLLQSFVSKFAKVHQKGAAWDGKYICIYGNIYRWNCCRIYMDHFNRETPAYNCSYNNPAIMVLVGSHQCPKPNMRGNGLSFH